jgi:hypothetical protein
VQGWIARNCTAALKDDFLHVTPNKAAGRRPFLASPKVDVPGPAKAVVELRSTGGGTAGFALRIEGQRDFPPAQTVSVRVAASDEWQEVEADLAAEARIIHLRVLLPEGESSIRRIGLASAKGEATKTWRFPARRAGR